MWHRLKLIAVEDVGTGQPMAPVLLNNLHENYRNGQGAEQIMMAVHAVRLLATSKKDRTSAEHTDFVVHKVAAGERVAVPDYALCVHTRAGQEMGRGLVHWWDNGAQVSDELDSADHSYRAELIELARAAEQGEVNGRGRQGMDASAPTAG
jgi:replication-associated recombination protein RarA